MSNPQTYCAYSTLTHTYIMHTQLYIYIIRSSAYYYSS